MSDPVDWKSTFQGVLARTRATAYFLRALELIEAGKIEEGCRHLSEWRSLEDRDLTGVPVEIIEQTETLCREAAKKAQSGKSALGVSSTIGQILEVWY